MDETSETRQEQTAHEERFRAQLARRIDSAIARLQPTADPGIKQQLTGLRMARALVAPPEPESAADSAQQPDDPWNCRCPQCTWD